MLQTSTYFNVILCYQHNPELLGGFSSFSYSITDNHLQNKMVVINIQVIPVVVGRWAGCQSITGQNRDKWDAQTCTQIIIPKGNLE